MRLLLLGNPRAGSWKWDIAAAGEALGWRVTHLPARDIAAADVVRQAKGADLFLWARTHRHDPTGDVAGMLRRIEDRGTATVALHLDLYWDVPRRRQQIGRHPWWTCQTVYTADGGDRPWAKRGVNHRWCPPPVGRRWLEPCTSDQVWRHRVVFVGSVGRVHGAHRRELIHWGRRTFGTGFAHLGNTRQKVTGHRLCGLYRTAEVVLGDSAPAPMYWSDRVPSVLARGGAILTHPRTAGMAEQGYTPEVMLLHKRGNLATLGEQIAALSPKQRTEMATAGRQLVADRHLWEHRLTQIAKEVLR